MTYPRALALSEVGWTKMQQRSWKSFTNRLEGQLSYLLQQGVNYRPPVELSPFFRHSYFVFRNYLLLLPSVTKI